MWSNTLNNNRARETFAKQRRQRNGPYQHPNHNELRKRLQAAIKSKKTHKETMKVGKKVEIHIEAESECAICLDVLKDKNLAITPCGHKFCFTCIAQNLGVSNNCPMCRTKLAPEKKEKKITEDEIINSLQDIMREWAPRLLEAYNRPHDDDDEVASQVSETQDEVASQVSETGDNQDEIQESYFNDLFDEADQDEADQDEADQDEADQDDAREAFEAMLPQRRNALSFNDDSDDSEGEADQDEADQDEADQDSSEDSSDPQTYEEFFGIGRDLTIAEEDLLDGLMDCAMDVAYDIEEMYLSR